MQPYWLYPTYSYNSCAQCYYSLNYEGTIYMSISFVLYVCLRITSCKENFCKFHTDLQAGTTELQVFTYSYMYILILCINTVLRNMLIFVSYMTWLQWLYQRVGRLSVQGCHGHSYSVTQTEASKNRPITSVTNKTAKLAKKYR